MNCNEIVLQDGETALHKAALRGHVEVVQQLMKYGAAVDIRNKVSKFNIILQTVYTNCDLISKMCILNCIACAINHSV